MKTIFALLLALIFLNLTGGCSTEQEAAEKATTISEIKTRLNEKNDPAVRLELGIALKESAGSAAYVEGKRTKAIEHLGQAIDELDRSADSLKDPVKKGLACAHLSLAYGMKISLASGKRDRDDWGIRYGRVARLQADRALEFAPESIMSRIASISLLLNVPAEQGGNPGEALKELEQLEVKNPESPLVKGWLGTALYKNGKQAEATAILQRVLELDPGDHFAQYWLKQIKG